MHITCIYLECVEFDIWIVSGNRQIVTQFLCPLPPSPLPSPFLSSSLPPSPFLSSSLPPSPPPSPPRPGIRSLQCILLKISLLLGLSLHVGVEFKEVLEPTEDRLDIVHVYCLVHLHDHVQCKYTCIKYIVHDTNHHVVPKSMQLQTILFRPG